MEPNIDYVFNIVNFTKSDSLFNYGMRPVLYSVIENGGIRPNQLYLTAQKEKQKQKDGKCGWYRYGKNVKYIKSKVQREGVVKSYYILSFTINWKNANDTIYLAHSFPYTCTRIRETMKHLINENNKLS